MIYKPKRRRYYVVKFRYEGQVIHRRTRATTAKDARAIESRMRSELARGNWGILEAKPAPTLSDFLRKDFLPFTESRFQTKPKTLGYYAYGAKSLAASDLARLRLEEITDQHAAAYAARHSNLSPSTINCGLRTLRRALSLAYQWGKLDRLSKITLAKGERQRERVLTDEEVSRYLEKCPQPWRDVATIMLGTGMRPSEVFSRRWERILLNGEGGLIQIVEGKSRAARRVLPMVPEVYGVLKARHEAQGRPTEGWVFPSTSACGHFEGDSAKNQHARALKTAKVTPFEPYCLRHTALTRLGEAGCDAFTLARIAGHSSILITQRYCHPQADAIERAFSKMAARERVVTDGGHRANSETCEEEKRETTNLSRRKG